MQSLLPSFWNLLQEIRPSSHNTRHTHWPVVLSGKCSYLHFSHCKFSHLIVLYEIAQGAFLDNKISNLISKLTTFFDTSCYEYDQPLNSRHDTLTNFFVKDHLQCWLGTMGIRCSMGVQWVLLSWVAMVMDISHSQRFQGLYSDLSSIPKFGH